MEANASLEPVGSQRRAASRTPVAAPCNCQGCQGIREHAEAERIKALADEWDKGICTKCGLPRAECAKIAEALEVRWNGAAAARGEA